MWELRPYGCASARTTHGLRSACCLRCSLHPNRQPHRQSWLHDSEEILADSEAEAEFPPLQQERVPHGDQRHPSPQLTAAKAVGQLEGVGSRRIDVYAKAQHIPGRRVILLVEQVGRGQLRVPIAYVIEGASVDFSKVAEVEHHEVPVRVAAVRTEDLPPSLVHYAAADSEASQRAIL